MLVHRALGKCEPTGGNRGHDALQEQVAHPCGPTDVQFFERTKHRHPHQQCRHHEQKVNRVVQHADLSRGVHHPRDVSDHHSEIEQHACDHWLRHKPHKLVAAPVAHNEPQQPLGHREQRQRWQEVGQDHVLQHVHRIEVLLADVVHGPIAGAPQHDHGEHKQPLLPSGDDDASGPYGARPNDTHRIDPCSNEKCDQRPDFKVKLKGPRIGGDIECGQHIGPLPA